MKDIPVQMGSCITLPQQDALELYRLLHRLLDAMEGN